MKKYGWFGSFFSVNSEPAHKFMERETIDLALSMIDQ